MTPDIHQAVITCLQKAGIDGEHINKEALPSLGPQKGAYILILLLIESVTLNIRALSNATLPPGHYLYTGNAYGPGGIESRLKRHFTKAKKLHWHIDHLTSRAQHVTAYAVENGIECDLIETLYQSDQFDFPLKGFGSSDCQICTSHLIRKIEP